MLPCIRKWGCRQLWNGLLKFLKGILLFSHLQPPPGAGEVSGESQQLVTAIYDQGDGLELCEQAHKVMTILLLVLLSKCCCGVSCNLIAFVSYLPVLCQLFFSIYILGSSPRPFPFRVRIWVVLCAHCLLFCGLDVVSFEQFCINLANEKLQQHFNQVFFNIFFPP